MRVIDLDIAGVKLDAPAQTGSIIDDWRMERISKLHVTRTPASVVPSGPAVVLLQGFTSSGKRDFPAVSWSEPLAALGRETLVPDLPGHGKSPLLEPGGFTTTQVLASIADAVESATTDMIDVVGYSLGARLAWDLVASSPKPVNKLVLGGLSGQDPFKAVDAQELRAFFEGGPAPTDPISAMMSQMMSAPGCDSTSLLSLVVGMGAEPFNPNGSPPAVPVLFLAGDNDPLTWGLEDVVKLVACARFERIPGDHFSTLHSEAFRNKAVAFLGV